MAKLKGLSPFSNVGVAEAGMDRNGEVEILHANEIGHKGAQFYSCVHPRTQMVEGDIADDAVRDDLVTKAKAAGVNFVMATPPCQGMGEAGNRLEFDTRSELIYYAVDIIKRIKPQLAITGNAPTILKAKTCHKGKVVLVPEYLRRELDGYYNFNPESLIKAMDCGVPQMRERNISLLARNAKMKSGNSRQKAQLPR